MCNSKSDFEEVIRRFDIEFEPRASHKVKLRWQMLSAFNEQGHRQASRQMKRSKIMRSPIVKFAIALTAAAVLIIVITVGLQRSNSNVTKEPNCGEPAPYSTPEPKVGPEMEPISIELPEPVFDGTPEDHTVANLEKPLGRDRPPFLAPVGTRNVALGKPVFSTDEEPIVGEIEMITDGDKEAADGSFVELGPFPQHVTIDLESMHNIYAVAVWHYHKQPVVYYDVAVQAADDRDFLTNVKTIFNNDTDNSIGLGIGKDKHYTETSEGKLINAKGLKARYIRLHSNGGTMNDLNHYIEVEVYGKPATSLAGLVPLKIELPRPMFVGTKEPIRVANLKKPSFRPRPPFLAPAGTKNVALGKPVFSSDEEPNLGQIEMITDGDKEACDGSFVEMNLGVQHVTIDLEAMHKIYAIIVWHYHKSERVYFDVVVQAADDRDFISNVRMLFNNDHDNSAGLGIGKDMHYVGTNKGKLINGKGVKARYIRLHSNGNNNNEFNHYIEVEVYGQPVSDAQELKGNRAKPVFDTCRLVPLEIELPRPIFTRPHISGHRGADFWKDIPNLEAWPPQLRKRGSFLVPHGTKNVALGKPVASTEEEPLIGDLKMITDGDKEGKETSLVELDPGVQSITVDLEGEYEIYAVVVGIATAIGTLILT